MGGYARHALRDAAVVAAALSLWSVDARLRGAAIPRGAAYVTRAASGAAPGQRAGAGALEEA